MHFKCPSYNFTFYIVILQRDCQFSASWAFQNYSASWSSELLSVKIKVDFCIPIIVLSLMRRWWLKKMQDKGIIGQFKHKYFKYANCSWAILVLGAVQTQSKVLPLKVCNISKLCNNLRVSFHTRINYLETPSEWQGNLLVWCSTYVGTPFPKRRQISHQSTYLSSGIMWKCSFYYQDLPREPKVLCSAIFFAVLESCALKVA